MDSHLVDIIPFNIVSNNEIIINSPKNSYAKFNLNNAIKLPKTENHFLYVTSATIIWNIPNIAQELNNNILQFTYETVTYQITFDKGLYDLKSINSNLNQYFINQSIPQIFQFFADYSTSKISVQIQNTINTTVNFSASNMRNILGFDPVDTILNGASFTEAQSIAQLNTIQKIFIHSNLCSSSVINSSNGNDIIASFIPDTSIGAVFKYEPFNIVPHKLELANIDEIKIYFTDQNNNIVDFNNENWTLDFHIKSYKK